MSWYIHNSHETWSTKSILDTKDTALKYDDGPIAVSVFLHFLSCFLGSTLQPAHSQALY